MAIQRHADATPKVRRLTVKGQATRARIVAAASRLALEQGVARTTLEDIQRTAGVSASQLYHYFEDRQAIVQAVIDHQSTEVLDLHRSVLERLDSFDALEAWGDEIVETQKRKDTQGGCPLGSLVGGLAETDPESRMALARSFDEWEALIRAGLESMRGRGIFPADLDVDEMALSLLAAIEGGLLLSQARRDTAPLKAALGAAIGHLRLLALSSRQPGDGC